MALLLRTYLCCGLILGAQSLWVKVWQFPLPSGESSDFSRQAIENALEQGDNAVIKYTSGDNNIQVTVNLGRQGKRSYSEKSRLGGKLYGGPISENRFYALVDKLIPLARPKPVPANDLLGKHSELQGMKVEAANKQRLEKARSGMKKLKFTCPTTTFDQLKGYGASPCLQELKQKIELISQEDKERLSSSNPMVNLERLNGICLYGPPGTGKTVFVQAATNALGWDFAVVGPSDIIDPYQGQSAINMKMVKEDIERYFEQSGGRRCLIFFDEGESLLSEEGMKDESRADAINTFKTMTEGNGNIMDKALLVIATNHLDQLNHAVLSRTPEQIKIGFANPAGLQEIVSFYLDLLILKNPRFVKVKSEINLRRAISELIQRWGDKDEVGNPTISARDARDGVAKLVTKIKINPNFRNNPASITIKDQDLIDALMEKKPENGNTGSAEGDALLNDISRVVNDCREHYSYSEAETLSQIKAKLANYLKNLIKDLRINERFAGKTVGSSSKVTPEVSRKRALHRFN